MHESLMSGGVEKLMKKYFVTIDDREYEELFSPSATCVFCEDKGAYRIGGNESNPIAFCEKCMLDNYKDKVRVEDD